MFRIKRDTSFRNSLINPVVSLSGLQYFAPPRTNRCPIPTNVNFSAFASNHSINTLARRRMITDHHHPGKFLHLTKSPHRKLPLPQPNPLNLPPPEFPSALLSVANNPNLMLDDPPLTVRMASFGIRLSTVMSIGFDFTRPLATFTLDPFPPNAQDSASLNSGNETLT